MAGRPELDEHEKRGKTLIIRLTPGEQAELKRAAKIKGEAKYTAWARSELLKVARRVIARSKKE